MGSGAESSARLSVETRRLSAGLEGVSKRIHYVSRGRGVMDAANNAALPSSPPGRGQGGEPRWLSRRARPDMAAGRASRRGVHLCQGTRGEGKGRWPPSRRGSGSGAGRGEIMST